MPQESILAHLAPRLTNQIENVATDALCHLLMQYHFLSDAFRETISLAGIDLPDNLSLRTQASWQDAAIPDLVGLDEDGRHLLIVESKFWAYLTQNQPATYIERLPADKPAILLFIAPAPRLSTLWRELGDRCSSYQTSNARQEASKEGFYTLQLHARHILALTSWESLLDVFEARARQVGEKHAWADIWQLQSLCDRVTEDAFLPLAEHELTSPTQKRIRQIRDLMDELMPRLVASGIASLKGYKATPGPDYYRRYMSLHEIGNWCVEYNETYRKLYPPAILFLTAEPWRFSVPEEGLAPKSFMSGKLLLIPLDIPTGVEKEAVVNSLQEQITAVANKIVKR
jgi:hypothetical protein